MEAAVLEAPGQPLELRSLSDPSPGPGELLIALEACGVCHADVSIADGDWPVTAPRVLGHEVIGRVAALGAGVESFEVGQRVATGWQHGSCGKCRECRLGRPMLCTGGLSVTGSDVDGGFAPLMVAKASFTIPLPEGLDPAEAAPLTCVGVTAFTALRRSGARAGDRVGVLGLGGMGHLAVQYAAASGMEVVVLSRDTGKRAHAAELGATDFVVFDGSAPAAGNHAPELDVLLLTGIATSTAGPALRLLRPEGVLVVLGFGDPFTLDPADLCNKALTVVGSLVGTPDDLASALDFSARHHIRSWVEPLPLARVNEGLARVRTGQARYRVVLLP